MPFTVMEASMLILLAVSGAYAIYHRRNWVQTKVRLREAEAERDRLRSEVREILLDRMRSQHHPPPPF